MKNGPSAGTKRWSGERAPGTSGSLGECGTCWRHRPEWGSGSRLAAPRSRHWPPRMTGLPAESRDVVLKLALFIPLMSICIAFQQNARDVQVSVVWQTHAAFQKAPGQPTCPSGTEKSAPSYAVHSESSANMLHRQRSGTWKPLTLPIERILFKKILTNY